MTNIGIILPDPGYHDALRALTREHGTLLVIDETHTICAGPGGYTAAHGLEPDFLTIGKPIAAGVPAGAYGMSAEVADRVAELQRPLEVSDVGGIGGTLSGNALSLAAMRATLERGPHRGGLRADDRPRRAFRGRGQRGDRRPRRRPGTSPGSAAGSSTLPRDAATQRLARRAAAATTSSTASFTSTPSTGAS